MQYKFEHFGVPTGEKLEGMIHYPEYRVWCTDYEKDPYRIEWMYFEEGCPMHPLIQTASHVCYIVEDIHKAVKGKKMLMKPTLYQNYWMAFIEERGVPLEFLQYL
jgi:hypothetical protein